MKWENPPPRGKRGHAPWHAEAAELRSRPGQWALLAEFPASEKVLANRLASQVRRGLLVAFRPAGAYECVARTAGKVCKVYARYAEGEPS